MDKKDLFALRKLKQLVEEVFRDRFEDCTDAIEDWKGKQIKSFQQDLMQQVGGHVSEKWFYTHIKTQENKKLPRVDILNLLSVYVGYDNWNSFKELNVESLMLNEGVKQEITEYSTISDNDSAEEDILLTENLSLIDTTIIEQPKDEEETKTKSWMWLLGTAASIGTLLIIFFGAMQMVANSPSKYRFCFVDADDQSAIKSKILRIQWLKKEESPLILDCDSAGCIELEVSDETVQLVVGGLYYKSDTIVRQLKSIAGAETIELKKDDYALMLHLFSKTKIKDWKKRRMQLSKMIAPDARIVQVYDANNLGMELYNKEEFINKLTMPIGSLGKIEILETHYSRNGLMQDIRFRQTD
ncbi:MAG: hypothetical protein GY810_03945 [Aureispira sp.]|nr:hypothetical protein [Aureispira sp.]